MKIWTGLAAVAVLSAGLAGCVTDPYGYNHPGHYYDGAIYYHGDYYRTPRGARDDRYNDRRYRDRRGPRPSYWRYGY
jgi:hypothetical protein